MTKTPAERQAEYRKRRQATGFKALTLWLPPEALAVLESYPKEQRDGIAAQAILAFNSNVTVANSNDIHSTLEALTRRVEALESALTLHNSDVTKTEHKAEPREPELEKGEATLSAITSNSRGELTGEAAGESASIIGESAGKLPGNAQTVEHEVLILKARALHAQGLSWGAIARLWNAEGTPTLSGTGQWHGSNVARLVNSHYSAS